MASLFLACAVLGGGVLVVQLAAALLGLDADADAEHGVADGLHLLSVRGVAAAVGFFGIAGRAALAVGLGALPAAALGAGVGLLAALGVAAAMRLLRNLESDGVVRLERAVGQPARVHVRIPDDPARPGQVEVVVQERVRVLPAVSLDGELPSGTAVTVVGLADAETLEVVRTPDPGA